MLVEEIKVGSDRMFRAFSQGIKCYQPTMVGCNLEEECGVTQISLCNLRKIAQLINRPAYVVAIGPEQNVLFTFSYQVFYLATGFSVGYNGEGPMGLAQFCAECGFGELDNLRRQISLLPLDFRGILFRRLSCEGPSQNERKKEPCCGSEG